MPQASHHPCRHSHDQTAQEEAVEQNRLTLTVEEAAEMLGISRAFAYKLVKRDELPIVRLGRRVVVPRRALETMLTLDADEDD